ncbi:flagellar basal body rod modification protein FlgD [Rhizobium leguminosarum bv. trifolii CB782]|uniref:Basal-body rod modification protein FlgD n=1 Tax=Rhizobium hidalgonense TaxID=1538159 RepID=A0A2A6K9C0_9HYPH|nr:flagellar hook assembly protein FlgD [Rhizobium hidalgonense]AHG44107.1 flagellar basal body rod modification protein FlgD [Rhizobium leguminosarum bv. trifolii CB782]EJC74188.1 flagellar hook capping protein [Rhizobium leguminosarum bv. trifolii WSM2012]MDR9775553.1 flagellar hook assembly protein FlgD [Rhizobium hidalgonense]MDR9812731.1 flagellar hook assembly protein FlgD [Rhizobium hidalgonense]MDR9821582.1 flagellar hook assembly protein FlgD [Rhizobium hidalgonense]
MAVDATSGVSTSTSNSTSSAQKKATLNYDNFLQLLIAQMKNQDPTDPVDASEQMSQLASFSQVEQTIQTNTKLDTLLSSSSLTQASSYVGKYMESADGTVKGIVDSVKVYSDGIIATTKDGGKILVQAGITVASQAPTTTTTTTDSSES